MTPLRNLSVVVLLALAGCYPTENAANYGPFPNDYEAVVTAWLKGHVYNGPTIKDLTITKPHQGQVWVGKLYGGAAYGWKTCVFYDVQNRDGKYTGIKNYTVMLRDGAVAYAGIWPLVSDGCPG
jgi:hypothetical protein